MELGVYLLVTFGCCTVLCWLLVDNPKSLISYLLYVPGYTGVILFQVVFKSCDSPMAANMDTVQPLLYHESTFACSGRAYRFRHRLRVRLSSSSNILDVRFLLHICPCPRCCKFSRGFRHITAHCTVTEEDGESREPPLAPAGEG